MTDPFANAGTLQTSSSLSKWDDDNISLFKNAVNPVLEVLRQLKEKNEAVDDEVKSLVKKVVAMAGVTRPATPKIGSRTKEKKEKQDQQKTLRFLGECCVCGLEKRGNYDRLGFLCAGCHTVPLCDIQTAHSTRVPRVRYSPHYVPSVKYPRKFDFLPEFDVVAAADLTPSASLNGPDEYQQQKLQQLQQQRRTTIMALQEAKPNNNNSTSDNNNKTATTSPPNEATAGTSAITSANLNTNSNNIMNSPAAALSPGGDASSPALSNNSILRRATETSGNVLHGAARSNVFDSSEAPGRYTVYTMDVPERQSEEMNNAVDQIRNLYHPSFLYNFAIARDQKRDKIWVVHETAQPIEMRGALLAGQRCYELLRQISVAALNALQFLKDFNRSHNDLRPHNFFIDDQHRVKLRLAPFPVQDLPAPFSYENSFFQHELNRDGSPKTLIPTVSGASFGIADTSDFASDNGSLTSPASAAMSQYSLRQKSTSFASKIDSYCLSRQSTRRKAENQDSKDMFVLGVTLTLIAYGDVERLPLPSDEEVTTNPDELFLVEFIWRLLTGERNPDEALRDDYLTTVRLVDGCAVETIVLRVVGPPLPPEVAEELERMNDEGDFGAKKKKKDAKKAIKFDAADGNNNTSASSSPATPAAKTIEDGGNDRSASQKDNDENEARKKEMAEKRKKAIKATLDATSVRFRVNRWNTAVAKLVSFFSNSELPAGENEHQAADPHLFQIIRTPTQLTFYSVRRDPRLLRARQIATEREVSSFNNALIASSSMTLSAKSGGSPSAGVFAP